MKSKLFKILGVVAVVAMSAAVLVSPVAAMSGVTLAVGSTTISVATPLPAPAGQEIEVHATWASAPSGQEARIELHRRTNAPNGVEGIVASANVDPNALKSGSASVRLLVPAGLAPSFDGAGLEIDYVLRVLVDIRFRPDAAIERPLGIV